MIRVHIIIYRDFDQFDEGAHNDKGIFFIIEIIIIYRFRF